MKIRAFCVLLCISPSVFAWGITGLSSYQNYQNQAAANQALNSYSNCMNQTPGACGNPPQAPAPAYQPPSQCHRYCYTYGPNQTCTTQCY